MRPSRGSKQISRCLDLAVSNVANRQHDRSLIQVSLREIGGERQVALPESPRAPGPSRTNLSDPAIHQAGAYDPNDDADNGRPEGKEKQETGTDGIRIPIRPQSHGSSNDDEDERDGPENE